MFACAKNKIFKSNGNLKMLILPSVKKKKNRIYYLNEFFCENNVLKLLNFHLCDEISQEVRRNETNRTFVIVIFFGQIDDAHA